MRAFRVEDAQPTGNRAKREDTDHRLPHTELLWRDYFGGVAVAICPSVLAVAVNALVALDQPA